MRREVATIWPNLRLNKSELVNSGRAVRVTAPGLSNPLAGQVAAILNNLFKQVRTRKLRARGTCPAPGLSNHLAGRRPPFCQSSKLINLGLLNM